mmetsp:Transcript_11966/g.35751  ORF Transcript_11966/g.35751 Transcript_11966/m.35751 type:complete len:389 (-) Transcript_11966:243-1409(-)
MCIRVYAARSSKTRPYLSSRHDPRLRGEREKSGVRTPRRAGPWRHRSRSRSRSFALEFDAPRGKLDLKGASKRRGGLAALPAQRERRPPFPPSAARLCEGVEEDAADGDGGSERAGRSERVAEDDEGDEDDGDALDGVGDGVRHRVNRREGEEGALIVKVVRRAEEQQLACERAAAHLFDGRGGARGDARPLDESGDGEAAEEGHEGEHSVQVLRGEVRADVSARHDALGGDGAQRKGDVGEEAGGERDGGEGDLRGRGEADAEDDGQQREVDGEREGLAEQQRREGAGEERLECLDDVCEGNSPVRGCDGGKEVARREAGGDRDELPHVIRVERRRRPQPQPLLASERQRRPEQQHRECSDGELCGGRGAREVPRREDLLVGDRVDD